PAIAILIAGVIDARGLSRKSALEWGTIWWFIVPVVAGVAGIVALAVIGRQFGLLVWPVVGAAAVLGFFAWRLYQADGAELEFLRGGECRFVFIEASQERSFSQRAEAIGLRYWAGPRVDAINISTGRPITIAVFHSAGSS